MAPPPMDTALGARLLRAPEHDCDYSNTRDEDRHRESALGAPHIHGELGKLGIEVSERTVSRLVRRPRRPSSQTWRTFLANHVQTLGSMDFFTVPTVTGRILFVFVVLLHHRRGSFTSTSRSIRRPPGPRSKSLRRFLMTRRPAVVARSRRDVRRGVPPPSRWHGDRRGP